MYVADILIPYLYLCSPCRVSRKLWTVFEMVFCVQQLHKCYALRTWLLRLRFVMMPVQSINNVQLQAMVTSTLMHRL